MCDQVETIFRAIEFIEAHLESEITVAQMAESVGYSLFHFIRTFNRVVHHAPYDYLTRRRLSEAARILITSDQRITDVSQDFCFNNQETFSRAFRRMFGVQPSYWRDFGRANGLDAALLMPPKTMADLQFCNRENFQHPAIEDLNSVVLYGLMTPLNIDRQTQSGQRSRLLLDLCTLFAVHMPEQFVAVTSPVGQDRQRSYCFIGAAVEEPFSAAVPLAVQALPAGRYVKIFAAESERQLALNYLYFTWFPKSCLKPARQMEIEVIPVCNKNARPCQTIYIPVDIEQDENSP